MNCISLSAMVGRSRMERCKQCGVQLLVPPLARTIRCAACNAVTNVASPPAKDHRFHGPVRHVTGWVKGIIHDFSSSSSNPWAGRISGEPAGSGAWPASYPSVRGKKRAVLCGVNYTGRSYELKGTVNDVNCMRYLLCQQFGFVEESILVLTEEERDPNRIPTKENIRAAMRWLVHRSGWGDSLVFHFSGHGSQKVDGGGDRDEVDGLDETLCPLDYEANGMILDDEINEALVRPIPRGAKLHALIDACHSGTMLDLPYLCRINNRSGCFQWEEQKPPLWKDKGTSGGFAVCISGCDDHQTSADTTALSRSTTTGAMTYSFIHALENEPGTTYGRMLTNMRSVIRGADTSMHKTSHIASFVKRMFNCGLTQEPQLSSSEMFDIYRKPFLL
ncbi:putative metacaspase-1 [Iris pallida]|uniref:Metacaspase-1 n=1 Tax=Iris pallida TaxID=29817 RepID=A0AAX6DRX4_IRIPA|nr:putative metacaspase-1 [Iris pallida]